MIEPAPRFLLALSLAGVVKYGHCQTLGCIEETAVSQNGLPTDAAGASGSTCFACGATFTPGASDADGTCDYMCATTATGCTDLEDGTCPVASGRRFEIVNEGRYGRGKRQAGIEGVLCSVSDPQSCYCATAENCNNVMCDPLKFTNDMFQPAGEETEASSSMASPTGEGSSEPASPTGGNTPVEPSAQPTEPPPPVTEGPPSTTSDGGQPPATQEPPATPAPPEPAGTGAAGDLKVGSGGWIKRFVIALAFNCLLSRTDHQE